MRVYFKLFGMAAKQMTRDYMLLLMVVAPILCGLVFKIGVPRIDQLLNDLVFHRLILKDYYLLFDIMLAFLAPYMLCTISSFILLEERDDNIGGYIAVTPAGKTGYLLSRLVLPSFFAFLLTVAVVSVCKLSPLSALDIFTVSMLSACSAVAVSLIVVTLAGNRVEGLALVKLTGSMSVGLIVPFFVKAPVEFLFVPLPSYWLAKTASVPEVAGKLLFFVGGVLCSLIWIFGFFGVFKRKIG